MFSNIIAGAAGFPVADLGDNINQSLRFPSSTGPSLSRTMGTGDSRKKFTVSVWVKRGKIPSGDQNHIWNYHANPNVCALGFNGNKLRFYHYDSGGTFNAQYVSSAVFRDTSAWYHIVASVDTTLSSATDRVKLWVNGTRITSFDTQTTFSQNYDTHVGVNNYTALIGIYADGSSFKFGGYVANKYFLDGITASETDFGRYQEDGVWVPKNYTGSYGTNGYRLNFADNSDLGNDVSGNNNDFTASGFNTGNIVSYNDDVYGDASTTYSSTNTNKVWIGSSFGPSAMFDGDLANTSCKSGTGSAHTWVYWRPNPPISISSSLVVHCSNTQDIRINGTSTGQTNDGTASNFPITIANPPSTLTEIAVQGNSISSGTIFGVVIDGTTIVNNFDTDVDYLDTPTSNYATLNPLSTAAGTPSKGNLAATSGAVGSSPNVPATIRNITSGDWYFEFEANNGNLTFGIATGDTTYPLGDPRQLGASGTDSIWFGANYIWSGKSGSHTFTPGVNFSVPWINGIRINIDAGEITFYGYGTSLGTFTFAQINTNFQVDFANKPLSFFINPIYSTTKVNWGQKPFLYRPAGFTNSGNLQLNNLPEPTIKDGSDHFQAITGPGNGVSSGTSGAGNYTPYLISGDPNGFGSSYPAVNAFDGSTSTYASPNDWTKSLSFIPATPIPYSSSLRIKCCKYADQTMKLNGVELSAGQLLGCAWSVDITGSGTLESFELGESTAGGAFLYAIEIDGVILRNLSILAAAQQTFPNGLWWIKDRENSNNHQLVSSEYSGVIGCPTVGSYQSTFPAYSAPSGNSVAWCWGTDATGLNKQAGFEIIQQLGTKTYTTVNHRLEKEPKCIIAFAGRGDLALTMYHASLGPNYRATMSSALQFYNEPAWWGGDPTDFTATTFGVGNSSYTNDDENFNGGMTYFVWTDIPGYSHFGSYEGNGNSTGNGPFIYTGFKPAFLIIKNADATGDWVMLDTTRTPNNVNEVAFKGNSAIPEAADANYSVDFLSNGFKIKSNGDADTNASSNTYVYMAFAEHPFGGENTAPATAR